MQAGRELDALVAKRFPHLVMKKDGDLFWTGGGRHFGHWRFRPSTDIAVALALLNKMQEQHASAWQGLHLDWDGEQWRCFWYDGYPENVKSVAAPTAPHAICLAAVKAFGVV